MSTEECPRISFDLHEDGSVHIAVSWPQPADKKEAVDMVTGFGRMIVGLCTGKLLPAVTQSIATFGANSSPLNKTMALHMLEVIQRIMANQGLLTIPSDQQPVVRATQVFQVRGGND